ncbi:acyltransferase family protein [Granulicella sibirica]|uniref:Putative transmembrane acyltransferase n=1 Tax=Granulicella sibirica TaxID=2479048 RepID=A0A4V1L5H0_9BACT|nr:acyltransferase [Granulicella sibirica]RXH55734.1 putative transmembrane acyltransferase [Granulicella sibirica]
MKTEQREQTNPGLGTGYLPTLDGWRAIAILSVILSHDRIAHLGRFSSSWFRESGGNRGVELFFAISGLLICSRLLQEERLRGTISLRGFYIRRLCRIQPAALLFLAIVSILTLRTVLTLAPGDLIASFLLVRNYLPLHAVNDSWYTGHFWSLSVEEHFYLLLPAFLLTVVRFRLLILGLLAVATELWRVFVYGHPALQFGPVYTFHTDVAVGAILLGAFAAVLVERPVWRARCLLWLRPSVAIGLSALVWLRLALHHSRIDHAALIFTLPILIVSTMLHPESLPGRLLESRPVRFVGRISYSLYLWQMLFFTFYYALQPPDSRILALVQQTPLRYVLVLVFALVSYYLVERPMIRLGHRLARPALPGREVPGLTPLPFFSEPSSGLLTEETAGRAA